MLLINRVVFSNDFKRPISDQIIDSNVYIPLVSLKYQVFIEKY